MNIIKGKIFTPDCNFKYGELVCSNGKIQGLKTLSENDLSPIEKNCYVIPGLVDIHMHGAVGVDVSYATVDELHRLSEYELANGITSFLPTTMTMEEDNIFDACKNIASALKKENAIKGIYLEGPFISKNKCGAQNSSCAINPNTTLMNKLLSLYSDELKCISIAPELDGALLFIKEFYDRIVISLGHSEASYEQGTSAILSGAKHITHLYNGMSYSHRNPGLVLASLDNKDTYVELICDGNHVHPSLIKNTFASYGSDRVVLISDSTEATGMADGEYMLGNQRIVKTENAAYLCDNGILNEGAIDKSGKTLAGSVTNLFDCMKYAISIGVRLEDAVKASTINPARSVGIDNKVGSFEIEKDADVVILNSSLNIENVIFKGWNS